MGLKKLLLVGGCIVLVVSMMSGPAVAFDSELTKGGGTHEVEYSDSARCIMHPYTLGCIDYDTSGPGPGPGTIPGTGGTGH